MFQKARDAPARPKAEIESRTDDVARRGRVLERSLFAAARNRRIVSARVELGRNEGLASTDAAAFRELEHYGHGGLLPERRDHIRIPSWRAGTLEVYEREADSSDDDGGVDATTYRYSEVKDVHATVRAGIDTLASPRRVSRNSLLV